MCDNVFSRDEGWGEGMSRMVIDDVMWSCLEKFLPKPKERHCKVDRPIHKGTLLSAFFRKLNALEGLLQDMIKQPECTSQTRWL